MNANLSDSSNVQSVPLPKPIRIGLIAVAGTASALAAALGAWEFLPVILFLSGVLITSFTGGLIALITTSILIVVFTENVLALTFSQIPGLSYLNLVLVTGFILLARKAWVRRGHILRESPLNIPILLLIFYQFASLVITHVLGGYPYQFLEHLVLLKNRMNPFFVFLIVYNLIEVRTEARFIFKFLRGYYLFILGFNLLLYFGVLKFPFFLYDLIQPPEMRSGPFSSGYRLMGGFADPNMFAGLLVLLFPLLPAMLLGLKKWIPRILMVPVIFSGILVLILTGSRGGFIGFAFSILVFFLLLKKTRILTSRQMLAAATIAILSLSLAMVFFQLPFLSNVIDRFSYGKDLNLDVLTKDRFTLWMTGLSGFLHAPLFGHGWNRFIDVHNTYLQYLAMLGVFGFGLFAWIIYRFAVIPIKRLTPSGPTFDNCLYLSYISGLCGLLVVMLGINLYHISLYLFLYAGLALKYGETTQPNRPFQSRESNISS